MDFRSFQARQKTRKKTQDVRTEKHPKNDQKKSENRVTIVQKSHETQSSVPNPVSGAREGPTERAHPTFWEPKSLPRALWERLGPNPGPPGDPQNGENPQKIATNGVAKAGRFTKLILGGSGVDFSCFLVPKSVFFGMFFQSFSGSNFRGKK